MRAVVVYESMYGNTHLIADTIGAGPAALSRPGRQGGEPPAARARLERSRRSRRASGGLVRVPRAVWVVLAAAPCRGYSPSQAGYRTSEVNRGPFGGHESP